MCACVLATSKAGGRKESWLTERKLVDGKKAGEREESW
jgi:hypothetical protein